MILYIQNIFVYDITAELQSYLFLYFLETLCNHVHIVLYSTSSVCVEVGK